MENLFISMKRLTPPAPFWLAVFPVEKLVLVLRDGRKLIGVLRSWDQFGKPSPSFYHNPTPIKWHKLNDRLILMCPFIVANLVLQGTVERLYAGNLFADIQRGIYLVRGENVLLLGEVVRCDPVQILFAAFHPYSYFPAGTDCLNCAQFRI